MQVESLLAVCAGFDNRKPGDLNVLAWQRASDIGHWGYDEAVDAICEWYSEHTDFVMPAHVQSLIRKHRAHAEAIEAADERRALPKTNRSMAHLWDGELEKSANRRAVRKTAVLAHADLAAKLCAPPISYDDPHQWNGGLPPLTDADGRHTGSPRAHALHQLVAEARARHNPQVEVEGYPSSEGTCR